MYWNPFDEMERMHRDMDRLLSSFWGGYRHRRPQLGYRGKDDLAPAGTFRMPACDFKETGKGFLATFEIPGAKKDEIELNVTEDAMEVKVEHKEEKQERGKDGESHYFSSHSFYRQLPLPAKVDPESVDASYRDGVLRVEMGRKQIEDARHKRIEVK
ncbi:Hsp20/alpha crystallin family protein [Candidatus Woesearchaeota archaeon]|nr:Hsp20/alpha crystallin family protein [Candidatus Woesearchaeota archaeon]